MKTPHIPTSAQIAETIATQYGNPNYMDMATFQGLLETAARAGKLAGLQQAQEYVSSNWPQGQYDRFNEHRLNNQIKNAITRVLERIKN